MRLPRKVLRWTTMSLGGKMFFDNLAFGRIASPNLTLRTGRRPDGHRMRNEDMPWRMTREFSDLELKAIRLHLLSLPDK